MNTVDWSLDRMQHTAEVPFNAALMPLGQLEWLDENRGFRYPILPNVPAITPFLTPLGNTERSESPPNGRPHRLSDLFRDNPSNEYGEEQRSYRDEPPELIPLLSDARTLMDSEDESTQQNPMQIVVSDFDEEEAGTKPSSFSSRLFVNTVAPTPTPTPTRPVRPNEHQIYRPKQTVVKPRQGGPFKIPSPTRRDDGKENGRISSWDGLNSFAYGLTEVPPRIFHNHHNSYPVVLNPSIGIHSYQRVPDNSTGIPDVDDLSEIASMTNNTNDSNERDNLDEIPIPEGDEIDDYSRKKKQNMKIVPNHMRGASDDSIPVILEPIMGDSKGISIRRHDSGKSDQSNGQNIRPVYMHMQKPTPVSIVARAAAEVAHAKFTVARRNRGPNGRIQISRKNTMTKLFGDGEEVKQDEGVSAIKHLLNSEKDKTIGELKDKNDALEKDMKLLMESKAKSMEVMASQMEKMRKEIENLKKENSKLREMYQSREPMIDLEHSCPNCDAMKDSKFRLIEVMSDEMLRLREICLKLHSGVSLDEIDDDELSPLLIPIVPPISVSRIDRLSLTHTTTPTPKSTTTYTAADPNAPRPSRTQDLIEHFPEINFSILQNETSNTSTQQPLLSTSPFPALSSPNSNVHEPPHSTDELPTSAATAAYLAAADRDNPFLDNNDQPYENHFHDRPLRSIKEEDLLSHASSALNSLTAVRLKSELDARRQMHEDDDELDDDDEEIDGEDMLAPPTVSLTPQSSGTPSLPGHHARMTSVTPTGTTILRKGTKSNSFDFDDD